MLGTHINQNSVNHEILKMAIGTACHAIIAKGAQNNK